MSEWKTKKKEKSVFHFKIQTVQENQNRNEKEMNARTTLNKN